MSKAFVKESEQDDEEEFGAPPIPPGVKNYLTPEGHHAMRTELLNLIDNERPEVVNIVSWAASNGDRSENGDYIYGKKRLREIDRRVRYLTKRLDNAKLVDPALQKNLDKVFFGATVTYREQDGDEATIKIVGTDEADLSKGKISWISPVANALLKATVGDKVKVRAPNGDMVLEILKICYLN